MHPGIGPDEPSSPGASEPDITQILSGLASSRVTAGPEAYQAVLTQVSALEPAPASRANLPGLALIELRVDSTAVQDVAAALVEVGGAVTGTAVSVLAWADRRGEVDITLVEQERDVTVRGAEEDPLVTTLEAGGVFAHLMAEDPVQVALTMHWFLDREQSRHRVPRPDPQVRDEYAQFASGLAQVVTHAASTRQKVLLDVQCRADGRRLVGLRTTYAEPPDRRRRKRRR